MEVLAVIGLVVGVVVLLVVIKLLSNVLGPAGEIERYARHIDDAIEGISHNLQGAAEIVRTRDLATAVPGLAVAFLQRSAR
jgi:uncharacterized membrane-anchored protein YhcB (DUF1043 family)